MSSVKNASLAAFSKLVLGTSRIAGWGKTRRELADHLTSCADLGITTLDTAAVHADYRCEAMIGEALALAPLLRHRLQFVSKCGMWAPSAQHPEIRIRHYDSSRSQVLAQVESTLRALSIERIDLLLVHRPDPLLDADELAETFCALKQSGKVAAFGAANFAPHQIELLQSRLPFPVVANQVECSLLATAPLFNGALDQCQKMRMMPMALAPLAGGRLDIADGALGAALAEISKDTGLTKEQIALAWLMRHPAGIHPVVGTGTLRDLESAVAASTFELDRQHWFALLEASQGHPLP